MAVSLMPLNKTKPPLPSATAKPLFKGFVLSIFYPNAYETHLSFSLLDGDDRLRQPKRSATAPH